MYVRRTCVRCICDRRRPTVAHPKHRFSGGGSVKYSCVLDMSRQGGATAIHQRSGLDTGDMKNFRPVSNLSFLSKLLERVVLCRLQAFLDSNDMMPPMQSAYRRFHSTETAVTTVYSDLLLAADVGQVSALCLLDLTAAFDTVDHHSCTLAPSRASVWSAWCCSGLVRFISDR